MNKLALVNQTGALVYGALKTMLEGNPSFMPRILDLIGKKDVTSIDKDITDEAEKAIR